MYLPFVVPTGEQQGQTEWNEVIAVTGRFEGISAQGLGEGAQTLDRWASMQKHIEKCKVTGNQVQCHESVIKTLLDIISSIFSSVYWTV